MHWSGLADEYKSKGDPCRRIRRDNIMGENRYQNAHTLQDDQWKVITNPDCEDNALYNKCAGQAYFAGCHMYPECKESAPARKASAPDKSAR
jgi:hypothetical protein